MSPIQVYILGELLLFCVSARNKIRNKSRQKILKITGKHNEIIASLVLLVDSSFQ